MERHLWDVHGWRPTCFCSKPVFRSWLFRMWCCIFCEECKSGRAGDPVRLCSALTLCQEPRGHIPHSITFNPLQEGVTISIPQIRKRVTEKLDNDLRS